MDESKEIGITKPLIDSDTAANPENNKNQNDENNDE